MSSLLNFHDPSELRRKAKALPPISSAPEARATVPVAENAGLDELKAMKVWICWNYMEKGSRKTKVPISATGTATGTNEQYRHTWVTFDVAKAAAEKRHYSGVGFVIPKGWFFLDIDHRDMEDPFVKTMLSRFDSYAEKSVSGNGLHIYGRCDFSRLPTIIEKDSKRVKLADRYYLKNPHNGMELYMGGLTSRYAVFTENVVSDKPLRDCTDAILQTLEQDMRKDARVFCPPIERAIDGKRNHNGGDTPAPVPDENLWDIIASLRRQKNGEKFIRLFDDGDLTGYGSQSEADLALCSILAFRAGPDPELIDRLFRLSALYRKKWERGDYRTTTIQKAIEIIQAERVSEFSLSSGTSEARITGTSAPRILHDFIHFNDKGAASVSVPRLVQYIEKNIPFLLVRDNGKQGMLKYVYDGGVYKLYSDDMFRGLIRHLIAEYDIELVKMRTLNETLQLLQTSLRTVPHSALNKDESIINFKNGLLHVGGDSLTLSEHTPDVLSTIQIPCNWTGEAAETPVFDAYLHTLTNGDKGTQKLLLEFIGACFSNIRGWRLKKSLFMVGEGDTGKSQLKGLVERLLGKDNFIGTDLNQIEARFGTGTIYGTRLAGSSDMSFMTVKELKTFKMLTGGDSVFAEFKGMQGFEFTYGGLLWFCMNQLPKFGGDDGKWVYDRIMVVNCPNVIPKDKQDKELLDKMYRERQGIIYKAVKALQQVIRNGYRFDEPQCVQQARAQYMADNNPVVTFFNECMQPWVNGKIQTHCTTGRVYKVFQAWSRENNNGYAKSAKDFRDGLAAYLKTTFDEMTVRRSGYKYYRDYGLTLEAKELYRSVNRSSKNGQ
jgi:P4 family phage/plasmid primase-like protien